MFKQYIRFKSVPKTSTMKILKNSKLIKSNRISSKQNILKLPENEYKRLRIEYINYKFKNQSIATA